VFNLTKVGFYDNTVKNFLKSRLYYSIHIVLCMYIQFMIGARKGTIRPLKNIDKLRSLGMTQTNKSCSHEENKSRLNTGSFWYH